TNCQHSDVRPEPGSVLRDWSRRRRRLLLPPLARLWRCFYPDALNRRDEAISFTAKCLDVSRGLRGVPDYLSQPGDGRIQPALIIDEGAVGPDSLDQHLSCADFTGGFDQAEQELERLILQTDPDTVFAQLTAAGVEFKYTEPNAAAI